MNYFIKMSYHNILNMIKTKIIMLRVLTIITIIMLIIMQIIKKKQVFWKKYYLSIYQL